MPALRTRSAASRDNPPCTVGRSDSRLINRPAELRGIVRKQVFG
jgi:hypothetical protein